MHIFRALFLFFLLAFSCNSSTATEYQSVLLSFQEVGSNSALLPVNNPSPLLKVVHKFKAGNRKVTAAVLAFPFPFGIVGLHRIFLGCPPYIPLVYIGSLGGIFGLMPLIDFVMILREPDVEKFANSRQVFMWIE